MSTITQIQSLDPEILVIRHLLVFYNFILKHTNWMPKTFLKLFYQ